MQNWWNRYYIYAPDWVDDYRSPGDARGWTGAEEYSYWSFKKSVEFSTDFYFSWLVQSPTRKLNQKNLKTIFEGDLIPDIIYKRMTAVMPGIHLIPGETLIFLDEIQNCAGARTAIKFLTEDGRFDVITSGSLLGLSYAENGDADAEEPESIPTGYDAIPKQLAKELKNFSTALLKRDQHLKNSVEVFSGWSMHP